MSSSSDRVRSARVTSSTTGMGVAACNDEVVVLVRGSSVAIVEVEVPLVLVVAVSGVDDKTVRGGWGRYHHAVAGGGDTDAGDRRATTAPSSSLSWTLPSSPAISFTGDETLVRVCKHANPASKATRVLSSYPRIHASPAAQALHVIQVDGARADGTWGATAER